jgi:hypothetical protein
VDLTLRQGYWIKFCMKLTTVISHNNLQGMHPVVLIYTKCYLSVTTQQLSILSFTLSAYSEFIDLDGITCYIHNAIHNCY